MQTVFKKIVEHKKLIIFIFVLATILCAFLSQSVEVNYDLIDYLPDSAPSTVALDVMNDEFEDGVPNAQIMVSDISIPQALDIKEKIKSIEGVNDITWLDDVVDIHVPLKTLDQHTVESYYNQNAALFSVTIDSGKTIEALDGIREVVGPNVAMRGTAVNTAAATKTSSQEVSRIMVFVIPLCFLILLLTTSSFIEPVLFMVTIGIAILVNNGTNILFGEISFVTNAAQSILQLAVSIDYSIFLLHRFSEYRNQGMDAKDAMVQALKKAFSSITASGITTAIGFAALILMRFKIGADMGIVMAKAIVISMISVLVLLPVLALMFCKLIDKTHHRSLMPKFKGLGKLVFKLRVPATIIALILIIPCILAQQNNAFLYGSSQMMGEGTSTYQEQKKIEDQFDKSNQLVMLVPNGNAAHESELCNELEEVPQISSVLSYVNTVGSVIPEEYVGRDVVSKLKSENYSRIVMTVNTDYESNEAFAAVETIRNIAAKYYSDTYHLVGDSVNTYDMKEVVTVDMSQVNFIAIAAIFVVLLLSFRSITIPLILVLVIEASIWINLSIPYFMDTSIFFLVYLIISSVQLGATVDYAILFANRYFEERQIYDKKEAVHQTISNTTLSILTSASLLTLGGSVLGIISTNTLLRQMGFVLARGAILSAILVLFVLPALLYLLDKIIQKTTLGLRLK